MTLLCEGRLDGLTEMCACVCMTNSVCNSFQVLFCSRQSTWNYTNIHDNLIVIKTHITWECSSSYNNSAFFDRLEILFPRDRIKFNITYFGIHFNSKIFLINYNFSSITTFKLYVMKKFRTLHSNNVTDHFSRAYLPFHLLYAIPVVTRKCDLLRTPYNAGYTSNNNHTMKSRIRKGNSPRICIVISNCTFTSNACILFAHYITHIIIHAYISLHSIGNSWRQRICNIPCTYRVFISSLSELIDVTRRGVNNFLTLITRFAASVPHQYLWRYISTFTSGVV